MEIQTQGFRSDLNDFFKLSGVMQGDNKHSNIIVLEVVNDKLVLVEIPKESMASLLNRPDDTIIIARWPGKWRSDCFRFSVGQWKEWMKGQTFSE